MTDNSDPCRSCGAPVRIETRELTRRLGEKKGQMTEVRVCTNRECSTNGPTRRLGETP